MSGADRAVAFDRRSADDLGGVDQTNALPAAGVAVLIWGATPVFTKLAVGGLDPLAVAALRTLLGGAVALPLLILSGTRPPAGHGARLLVAVAGLCGFALFPVLFTLGMALTGAGRGALILGTLPVLTGLVVAAVERRLPGRQWWFGCVVALLGLVLLVDARVGFAGGRDDATGGLLVVASALCAASGYVAGAHAARTLPSWRVTLWGLVLGGVAVLPMTAVLPSPGELARASGLSWAAVAYLALGSSILAYALWYRALQRGGIARTGLLQFLQPVIGLVLAVSILQETLTWPMAAAGCAVLGGVAIARARR